MAEPFDQSVVARFKNHSDAEEAVRRLERAGIPLRHISIIGRDFQLREQEINNLEVTTHERESGTTPVPPPRVATPTPLPV